MEHEQTEHNPPGIEPPVLGDARKPRPNQILQLRSDECRPRGDNLREWGTPANRAKVLRFANSIADGGIRNSITVSRGSGGGIFDVEDGETRWRAVRYLEGWDEYEQKAVPARKTPGEIRIPARLIESTANEVDRLTDLMVRQDSSDFSDYEKAQGIKRYIRYGSQLIEIATKLAWSLTTVQMLHTFNQSPQSLQILVRDGKATAKTIVDAFRAAGGPRADDPVAVWQKVERDILDSIKDLQDDADREYTDAIADVRRLSEEAQRLANTPEGDEPARTDPGKRARGVKPITRREQVLRDAAEAGQRADRARQRKERGPSRITSTDISAAQARKNPDAAPAPKMTRSIFDALLERVRHEAACSPDLATRERCNDTLTKYGFPSVAAQIDGEASLEASVEPVGEAETIGTSGSIVPVSGSEPSEGNIAA